KGSQQQQKQQQELSPAPSQPSHPSIDRAGHSTPASSNAAEPSQPVIAEPSHTSHPSQPHKMHRFQIQMESSSLGPRPSLPTSSISAPPGVLPLITLSDAYISPAPSTFLDSTTSLQELAHLVKLQNYQKHKQAQCRLRLHRSLVSTALASRFIRIAELGHSLLVEHLKSDQKKDFAVLYNAILDIRSSCDAFRRFALIEEDYDSKQKNKKEDSDEKPRELVSFLHETPAQARDTVLAFLSTV